MCVFIWVRVCLSMYLLGVTLKVALCVQVSVWHSFGVAEIPPRDSPQALWG